MVACAFPPTGGSGVQRSAQFAKYLSRSGWLPTVWTVKGLEGMPQDPTLLSDLPEEVTVHAREDGGKFRGVRRWLRGLGDGDGIASNLGQAVDWRLEARLARAGMPDQYSSWARASLRPLCRLIRDQQIDAIYSTFSPASNHLLGLLLRKKTNLPWVADFRDLWTDDYRYRESSPKRQAAHHRLEQQVLETADAVVGVTHRQTAILAGHVPKQRHRFVTITNGFDPSDFASADIRSSYGGKRFVLAHVGRFDRWRTNDDWFAGLRQFVTQLGSDRERFLLRLVGHVSGVTREKTRATGVEFAFTGYVSHGEAVREMRSADALLLNVPQGRNAASVIPAKLFEYLAAQRPILVVGPARGECEAIVRSCDAGLSVGFDEQAIANGLGRLHSAWRAGRAMPGCSISRLGPYSRITLTGKLATVLDQLVGRGGELDRRVGSLAGADVR
jgi:glycosyltransferase involved in cell wall biosynthesis